MLTDTLHETAQRHVGVALWIRSWLAADFVSTHVNGDNIVFRHADAAPIMWGVERIKKYLTESDPASCFSALWWLNRAYDTRDETSWHICDCLWSLALLTEKKPERVPLYLQRRELLIAHLRRIDFDPPKGVVRKMEEDQMILGIGPSDWAKDALIDFLLRRAT